MIADRLHDEGFKPAKGTRITAQVVRTWLSRHGLTKRKQDVELAANEWTIPQILDRFQVPTSTVHGWIRHGRIKSRQIGGRGGRLIIEATSKELELLANNRRKPAISTDQ